MLIRDLKSWPPQLTDSQTLKVSASENLPAVLKRCGVYWIGGSAAPYLSIVFEYQGRSWHAMMHEMPESLMRRVAATLELHVGRPLEELGALPIVADPPAVNRAAPGS